MTKGELILGIDPGTCVTGCGWISIEGHQETLYRYDMVKTSAKQDLLGKYGTLLSNIEQMLKADRPTAVVLETQFVYKNPQSALKLGVARGVIIAAAIRNQVPIFEYTPAEIKKSITGKGNASKEHIQFMVKQILKMTDCEHLPNYDVSDAFAIALCHVRMRRYQAVLS